MKKIILCADDYGQNEAISQAIIQLVTAKRLSATSCMVTTADWQTHAAWLQPFKDQIDIGLHFNLTEGKPLSAALPRFMSLPMLLVRASLRLLDAEAIAAEFSAQLAAFQTAMGQLPHFIDGHQHIHQLPVVRAAILRVYEKQLRQLGVYMRYVHGPRLLAIKEPAYLKRQIIQLLGASAAKQILLKHRIPHNPSFAGVYHFADAPRYAQVFPQFLAQITEGGIIMCHPGLAAADAPDAIASSRLYELEYFKSDQFLMDCRQHQVTLGRFK